MERNRPELKFTIRQCRLDYRHFDDLDVNFAMMDKSLAPLLVFLFFFSSQLCSQSGDLLIRLLSLETNDPIAGAHVFFDNTTSGDLSDENGEVSLKPPAGQKEKLIISHLSYESKIYDFEGYSNFEEVTIIYLETSGYSLEDVVVSSKRNAKWKKNYRLFKSALLGTGDAAEKCEILNPEVLRFENQDDLFEGHAIDLIKIRNNYLGYQIDFLLKELVVDRNGSARYRGHAKFEDLFPEGSNRKVKKNREVSFKQGPRYFFWSLIEDKIEERKFEVSLARYQEGVFTTLMVPERDQILAKNENEEIYELSFVEFLAVKNLNVKVLDDNR
ncbi:MAG: hypothetical protein HKN16_05245, partial [Saprospiraceae bacterium]|nr:hypothetical protein [Saprospiraceae bacterium]